MARIRTIKPEFFTSEDIVEMEPLARLLYIALWCEADKEGRFAWKPKTFKMRYLPADTCDIDAICDALLTRGLVCLYGDGLAVIPSFKNHQHINPREKDSVFPSPGSEELTRAPRVNDASVTRREEGRKEGKGKEGREGNLSEPSPDAPPIDPDAELAGDTPTPEAIEKRTRRRGTEEDEKCARWLYGQLLNVLPSAKEPNWNGWSDDVRLMREVDKRTHHEICELFLWATKDAFWCRNILSPSKLREKWDQLQVVRQMPTARSGAAAKPSAYQVAHIDHSETDRLMAEDMARRGTTMPADGNLEF